MLPSQPTGAPSMDDSNDLSSFSSLCWTRGKAQTMNLGRTRSQCSRIRNSSDVFNSYSSSDTFGGCCWLWKH
eukprot:4055508-Pyramimonas_sp.AAC.2